MARSFRRRFLSACAHCGARPPCIYPDWRAGALDLPAPWLAADPIGAATPLIGRALVPKFRDGRDPRDWEDADLGVLVSHWRMIYVGEDGWLSDSFECECGHHHLGPDGEYAREDVDGCVTCSCTEWRPGNRAAEVEAKKEAANA